MFVAACAGFAATLAAVAPVGALIGTVPSAPGIAGGSNVTALTPTLGNWGYSLVSLNGSLYFTTTDSGTNTCSLRRSDMNGQNRTVVTTLLGCTLMSVAVGPDGRLWYAAEVAGASIYSINPNGTDKRFMATATNGASRLVFDGLGHLYVESQSTGDVTEMNLDGTHSQLVSISIKAYGFGLDHSGHMLLSRSSTVYRKNVDGTNTTSFPVGSNIEGVLALADGNLLLSDYGGNKTYVTDTTGSFNFVVSTSTHSIEQIIASSTPGTYYYVSWSDANVNKLQESPFAVAGNNSATVSWTPSASSDAPLLGYTVTAHPFNGGPLLQATVPPSQHSTTFYGLTNAQQYQFSVYATNIFGDSEDSALTNPVVPGAQFPSAPHVPQVTAQSGAVKVSLAGANANGSAITGYLITAYSGTGPYAIADQQSVTGSATSATLGGLNNGVAYRVTVTAINAIGVSDSSAMSASFVPAGPPTWSSTPTAVAGSKSATVKWTTPSNNGSFITGYKVLSTPGAKSCSTTTALSCTVKGLSGGTSYTFKVTATNAKGSRTSPATNKVTAKH